MGGCMSSRMIHKNAYNHNVTIKTRNINQHKNESSELQPYWTNYTLNQTHCDIIKDPNVQNVCRILGI